MIPFLSLTSFLLFFVFILALILPKIFISKKNPRRWKSFIYYFIPSIIIFSISASLDKKENEEDWQNPEGVTELQLYKRGFKELPDRLVEFKELTRLNIENNEITKLDKEIILSLPTLKILDLSGNPLGEVPEWLSETNIERLDVSNTLIESIPKSVQSKIKKIDYDDTPLEKAEIAVLDTQKKRLEAIQDSIKNSADPEGESFGQFAVRKLMGKDHGYNKMFKGNKLYYTKSIKESQVDSLGNYLIRIGYFNEDKNIDMQITYSDTPNINAYELKAIMKDDAVLSNELEEYFKLQAIMISHSVFNGQAVHFVLTGDGFEKSIRRFKSNE